MDTPKPNRRKLAKFPKAKRPILLHRQSPRQRAKLDAAIYQLNGCYVRTQQNIYLSLDLRRAMQKGHVEISRRGLPTRTIPIVVRTAGSVAIGEGGKEIFVTDAAGDDVVQRLADALRAEIEKIFKEEVKNNA